MQRNTIIILDDDLEHVKEFERAAASLSPELRLRFWYDAPSMIAECLPFLPEACLISIDHYLEPLAGSTVPPGTGLQVVKFLSKQQPACPVILHTASNDHAWSMYTLLRDRHWYAEMVIPAREGWIQEAWLPRARALCEQRM